MKKSRSEKDIVDTIRKLPQKHKLSPESREHILTAIRQEYEGSVLRTGRSRQSSRKSPVKKWKAPLVSGLAMGFVVLIGFTLWKSAIVPPMQTNKIAATPPHTAKKEESSHTLSTPAPKTTKDPTQTKPKTSINPHKQSFSLNHLQSPISDIKMVNDQVGWLQAGNQILSTQDGGKSWQNVTPKALGSQTSQGSSQSKAEFYDAKNAWFAVTSMSGSKVYHTQDGGTTWKATPINDKGMIGGPLTLTFSSENEGWLLQTGGVATGSELVSIFHTSDGGNTWDSVGATQPNSNQKDSLPLGGLKSGLSVNQSNLWLSGHDYYDVPYLYKSIDMGVHWQKQAVPVPNGYSAAGGSSETFPPQFFNQSEGIIPVRYSGSNMNFVYVFYLTQDGGKTWQAGTGAKSKTNADPFYQIIDDHHIAVVMDTNTLYMSSDQGQSWQTIPLKNPLDHINFIDQTTGFGYHGKSIYKTVDGGKTWTQVAS